MDIAHLSSLSLRLALRLPLFLRPAVSWSRPDTTIRAMADAGYNVIIMAFYLSDSGAVDFASAWTTAIGDTERAAAVAYAHSKGAVVLMSVGGATDGVWHTKDAATLGARVGQYALSMRLDGVDFDLEVSDLPDTFASSAIASLFTSTAACRTVFLLLTRCERVSLWSSVCNALRVLFTFLSASSLFLCRTWAPAASSAL